MKALSIALAVSLAACGSDVPRKSPSKPSVAATALSAPAPGLRLDAPRLMPDSYRVELRLDPAEAEFRGVVVIEGTLSTTTTDFMLNAHAIEVASARIETGGATRTLQAAIENEEFIRFTSEEPLAPGEATVTIEYKGTIDDAESFGIFRQRSERKSYLFTQFEARGARRAFPSVDQPDIKVPMELILEVPADQMALGNTPEVGREELEDGFVRVSFAPTPPLPTYLLAFAVGPFEAVEIGTSRGGAPVRVIVPEGRSNETRWVVESTLPLLAVLEDEFGSPYPFKKLDLISVPATGTFGAMENPGLVTFTESLLLAENETLSFRRSYASVAAHEFAHQWFGNLVTCNWWDDLWLNEAFATWAAAKTLARWKPEWRADASWISRKSGAMRADRLATARVIHQPIESEGDIGNAFDGITYSKGASVIAMVEAWVGEDAFRSALRGYLSERSWKSPTTEDFLTTMDAQLDGRASSGFQSFLSQPGTPEIAFELSCPEGSPPSLSLSQSRYAPLGSKVDTQVVYGVPICIRYPGQDGAQRQCTMLDQPKMEWKLEGAGACPAWIVPNAGGTGYYRSALDGEAFKRLLKEAPLEPVERLSLLDDLSAAVAAGHVPLSEALALVPALAKDDDPQVVSSAARLADLGRLVPDKDRARYARWIGKHFGARARKLGFAARKGESDELRSLRPELLGLMIDAGQDRGLARKARTLADKWLADAKTVDPDLAGLALGTAARDGDQKFFLRLVERLKKTVNQGERKMIYAALARFDDPALFDRALVLAVNEQYGYRETLRMFQSAASHRENGPRVLTFFVEESDKLLERVPEDARTRLARAISPRCEEENRAAALAFLKEHVEPVMGGSRVTAQSIESIDLCLAQRKATRLPETLPR